MSEWRDIRKKQVMEVNAVDDLFINELEKRTKIDKKYLLYLDACEIKSIKYLQSIKPKLLKRPNGFMYWVTKNGIKSKTGQIAIKLNKLLEKQLIQSKIIKGVAANKGKITNRVKIVISPADFTKINKKDILVTQMTRPEFMPVIHKAGAIITDEGGITCHAAIVSRELNIPCIIATQIATCILKDGDLVEVDADKGVVKIIE